MTRLYRHLTLTIGSVRQSWIVPPPAFFGDGQEFAYRFERLRAQALAISLWDREASRFSMDPRWPLPVIVQAFQEASSSQEKTIRMNLACLISTLDASEDCQDEQRPIDISMKRTVRFGETRRRRQSIIAQAIHELFSHEINEFLLYNGQRFLDPHARCAIASNDPASTASTTSVRPGLTRQPSQAPEAIASKGAHAALRIQAIKGYDPPVEDRHLDQKTGESTLAFAERTLVTLEDLLAEALSVADPDSSTTTDTSPTTSRPERSRSFCLDRDHWTALGSLLEDPREAAPGLELGDAVLLALLSIHDLHPRAYMAPGSSVRLALQTYVSARHPDGPDAQNRIRAVNALLDAAQETP